MQEIATYFHSFILIKTLYLQLALTFPLLVIGALNSKVYQLIAVSLLSPIGPEIGRKWFCEKCVFILHKKHIFNQLP